MSIPIFNQMSAYQRNRVLLFVGTALCVVLFRWTGDVFGIPPYWEASASLLAQRSPVVAIVVTCFVLVVATVIASMLASSVRADAGFVCAMFGLAALSSRGGWMRYAFFNTPSTSIFVRLIVETLILFVAAYVCWTLSRRIAAVVSPRSIANEPLEREPLDQCLIALVSHALAMIAAMSLLCRTDQKTQVLMSVGISAFLASLAADAAAPVPSNFWTWASPFVVALVAYVSGLFAHPFIEQGQTGGFFAALGRPLPLDYAGAGAPAALLGLWVSRSWRYAREEGEEVDAVGTAV